MITRVPIINATTNTPEYLQGDTTDVLREQSILVDRRGKTYDARKGVPLSQLPTDGAVQLAPTTWYAFAPRPVEEDLVIVGYLNGPEGCVPIYERRTNGKNSGVRTDGLRSAEPDKPRRNWRARKAARHADALELPHDVDRGSGGTQP